MSPEAIGRRQQIDAFRIEGKNIEGFNDNDVRDYAQA